MKGNFSRLTGLQATRKHYQSVLKQQGRVQLDSDWNELLSIIDHQRRQRTVDTIGRCGAPIHHSGFQVFYPEGAGDLLFSSGRFYAGGLLAETTPAAWLPIREVGADQQLLVDDLHIDGQALVSGQWVQVVTDEDTAGVITTIQDLDTGGRHLKLATDISFLSAGTHPRLRRLLPYSQQDELPVETAYTPEAGYTDLVYLDVWERHITAIEDPVLREVALGGPDTDTRSKIVAQVKILPKVGQGPGIDCSDAPLPAPPDGRLSTLLADPDDPDDPCELGESGGYHGLENRLYRVEIHQGSTADAPATFKWSRDNAAQAYAIDAFLEEGGEIRKIRLHQNGKDEILAIQPGDWIELAGDAIDLDTESAGILVKVEQVLGTTLVLDRDVAAYPLGDHPKVRRWDLSRQCPEVETPIVPGSELPIENGIQLKFSGSEFRTGDYWVFSARTLTGDIERLEKAAPLGIHHHYCRLALVTGKQDGTVIIKDCRPEFPPLTEQSAGAGNGCCTVTVSEGGNIQEAIDALQGGPGTVCLQSGSYYLDQPLQIKGSNITLKGCGGPAILIYYQEEEPKDALIEIRDSRHIALHHLWCLSSGTRAVMVENSLFFHLSDCLIACLGTEEAGAAISCRGVTMNTTIYNNYLLAKVAIRYEGLPEEQELQLHSQVKIARNTANVLDSGIQLAEGVGILGIDVVDNVMRGIGQDLLTNAYVPDKIVKAVARRRLFAPDVIAGINTARKQAEITASRQRINEAVAYQLHDHLATQAGQSRINREEQEAIDLVYPSGAAIIELEGPIWDGRLLDNVLEGSSGIQVSGATLETSISSNQIIARQSGIELALLEGVTVEDNLVTTTGSAIICNGQLVVNLQVANNRMTSRENGLQFLVEGNQQAQYIVNVQVNNNAISAGKAGIWMDHAGIILQHFTIVDNTISNTEIWAIRLHALDESLYTEQDPASFQRVIQRNSISALGGGISVNVSDTRILNNEINIFHNLAMEADNSRGIELLTANAEIGGNAIQGLVDVEAKRVSYGGILLSADNDLEPAAHHHIHIHHNRISGGRHHGIEIAFRTEGLTIEENQIFDMGLNGIAVRNYVPFVKNLRIRDNLIEGCLRLEGATEDWWQHGGVVLTAIEQAQITGNVIKDNGSVLLAKDIGYSAIYVDRASELRLAGNQLLEELVEKDDIRDPHAGDDDLIPRSQLTQAMIQIQSVDKDERNADLQIADNQVRGNAPALIVGFPQCEDSAAARICEASDERGQITGNHFESALSVTLVQLQIDRCIFSDNYVDRKLKSRLPVVQLGYGRQLMVNGNMTTGSIGSYLDVSDQANQIMMRNNLEL